MLSTSQIALLLPTAADSVKEAVKCTLVRKCVVIVLSFAASVELFLNFRSVTRSYDEQK